MKTGKGKAAIASLLIIGLLCGCAMENPAKGESDAPASDSGAEAVQTSQTPESSVDTATPEGAGGTAGQLVLDERPRLINLALEDPGSIVVPNVGAYTVEPDFSNIDNRDQFYLEDELGEKLARNAFVVYGSAGAEFFEVYESNRYAMIPSFVTVDSLMHTYHLYFSHLLKNVEKGYMADRVLQLGRKMLENSVAQYDQLKGTEWESAAKRNVAYFTVGCKLQDDSVAVNDYVAELVQQELGAISQADGIHICGITEKDEDYSQYTPRGYYEGDPGLEQYFRAMMWYGRIHFLQEEEDLDRSALLMAKALSDDSESYDLWEGVYAVTSFFAGASDDSGVCEYVPAIREAYGEGAGLSDLVGNEDAFSYYHALTGVISAPQINSLPIDKGESNVIPGFRFMGQRFTIDAAIMQKLIYSSVEENGAGATRMLPDVLDVPAALGSDTALRILEESGAMDYAGYSDNMQELRSFLGQDNESLWSASLYASWLNTLRPLLEEKAEGYPAFMRSQEWLKKNLECFAGSFTELKHDTILYSKQVMAEMGGGYEERDDRGYVEPEPVVYSRFMNLASLTVQGLKRYGMLDSADEENLTRLAQMAERLLTIAKKELREESLTDEEYEFIRTYGGNIEHLWRETLKDQSGEEGSVTSREFPAAIVVDIATDPNGQVLELGTGSPSMIYVAVKVDGGLRIARGSVYTFYQFPWPMDDRLTDSKWRQMMGLEYDENGNYNYDRPVRQPDWTASYRYEYAW